MLNTCNVSGLVYAPDGRLARNCRVSFLLSHRRVMAQDDKTIVPMRVEAGTDASGALVWVNEAGVAAAHVPLAPGGYEAHIFDPSGAPFPPVKLGVPDEAETEFSAIIDLPPPVSVVQEPKGDDGLSAYEVALDNGFIGTEAEWLESLVGPQGPPGDGSGGGGGDDASAYEIAVANGFVGTETEWLESLVGADGSDGEDGLDGAPGADGSNGEDGQSVTVTVVMTDTAYADAVATAGPFDIIIRAVT